MRKRAASTTTMATKEPHLRHTASSRASVNACPVERMEFQTLASLVRSLKEESCRHLQLETETQTEMEYLNAQVTSTRKGLGKIAELLNDDLTAMRTELQHEMQALQVDCINRVEELTAAVERLTFRFTHHIRDCQALGDEVDRLKDSLHQTNAHLYRTDADMTDKHNHVSCRLAAMDQVAATVEALCKEHLAAIADVNARMTQHSAWTEARIQEAAEFSDRRWDAADATRIRHDTLVHSVIHDLVALRDQVGDMSVLRQTLQRHMDGTSKEAQHGMRLYHALESRVSNLSAALDTCRTQHQNAHDTLETTTSMRLDALAETLELAVHTVVASTTSTAPPTTTRPFTVNVP
ncbi:hypothetical protein H310_02212 [Aphanomyces invadans]|uniref:Uncharacterized protein n=1 Tax=Aphanomyces invadans TaxID=157072 RepID=A0A024UN92_9STRA|nr:hypothetical protein H310_02212 [Aphanomyces invadans]ETW07779.1 hypothetical protein H310_02212 [Aphanomyces invadans]|eukprot:XP_008863872.1 hypothetical protein H310_02212 [Aphanomyces invadans]